MVSERFDAFTGTIGRRGAIAALLAAAPWGTEAKNKKKKRRKRRRKQAEALRRLCQEACPTPCNCIYNVSGEILCTGNFAAICAETCTSDAECSPMTSNGCFTALQVNGSATKTRFDCDYSVGVCVGLGSC